MRPKYPDAGGAAVEVGGRVGAGAGVGVRIGVGAAVGVRPGVAVAVGVRLGLGVGVALRLALGPVLPGAAVVGLEHGRAGAQLWLASACCAVVFLVANGLTSRTADAMISSPPASTRAVVKRRRTRGSRPPIIPSSRSRSPS
ncbi:MAG: hypothetical protein E6I78_05765 [Chloroflexi bacterium]|nr:MAG: hypothetical protein E6I78_05765 [Chloroflexota bacterium]